LLCKARWDIEKVVDDFKNKLGETKARASHPIAKNRREKKSWQSSLEN
jgi:hypothetical protein